MSARGSSPGRRRTTAVLVALPFLAPMVYLGWRLASAPGAAGDVLGGGLLWGPLGRTLLLGAAAALGAVAVGTTAAWLIARCDLPARRTLAVLLALPLVIPSFIGAFALVAAFAPGGVLAGPLASVGLPGPPVRGFWAALAVIVLLTYPFVFLPVVARLSTLPRAPEELARTLGRTPLQVFRDVVVPGAWPSMAGGGFLVFLYAISDFGAVQLLRYDALTREIYARRLFDTETAFTLSIALGIVALVAAWGHRALSGRTPPAGSPGQAMRVSLGAWRAPAYGFLAVLLGLALIVPVGVLAWWATRGIASNTGGSRLAADPGAIVSPAINSTLSSVAAAVVATILVLPLAYLLARHPGARTGQIAAGIVAAGFAIPGLVVALAIVFWAINAPGALIALYQSLPLLILAYVINFGVLSLESAADGVRSLPRSLDDAGRMLGRGPIARFFTIELPLIRPALLAGAGLVMLSAMKELPATLLLAPTGFTTLATRIWGSAEESFLADASIAALVLIALSGVLTWLLVIRRALGAPRA